jgi:serine phosphatase RsbU (regulator of sigma subunit)
MDGSIISYDLTSRKLVYSCAYNPLYLIRDNKIIELKGDRMPLSYYAKMTDFSSQEIKTRRNDRVYLSTDGFIAQFGGQKQNKIGSAQFKELLIRHHMNPLEVQKQLLVDTFLNWKGKEEQVDDITVVGLRL